MPREIFGSVTDPSARPRARKWPTVLLSFGAHALVLMLLVVIPLMATGVLPMPKSAPAVLSIQAVTVPAPPPLRRAVAAAPPVNGNAAPVVAPDNIVPEPEIAAGFENEIGNVDGLVGGIATGTIENAPAVAPQSRPEAPPQAPVRVGLGIRAPVKVRDVLPVYPPMARIAHAEGIVVIEATIGVDGRVQDARILRSHALLDQAALDAVRQWTYTPTTLNGVAVPVVMTVTVRFQLQR